jgi:hypothetical protein
MANQHFNTVSKATGRKVTTRGNGDRRRFLSEYESWYAMMRRCYDTTSDRYATYGAIGIHVCERWHTFALFLEDMGPRPTKAHTIDRLDNDGNYEPSNARWATKREQQNNRRCTVWLTYNGETLPLSVWSERFNIPSGRVHQRIKLGWSIHKALTEPLHVNQYG